MNVRRIPLVDLRRDGGTQVRETMNAATVQDYADALAEGVEFPAVTVFFDGEAHWLADGFHRVLAHERAGLVDVLAEVRTGSKRDALWFALSANGKHGLQMSPADRRRAISLMLKDEEWGKSDRSVADKLGVSPTTVGKIRKEMGCPGVQIGHLDTTREGSDGKTYGTPGDSAEKVRELLANPEWSNASDRQVAKHLDVSPSTVAKVRKDLTDKKISDVDLVKGQTLCDTLVEIGAAKDSSTLGVINGTVANRPLSDDGREQVERAIQRRYAELREQGRLATLRAEGERVAQDLDLTGEDADLSNVQRLIDEEAASRRNAREQAPAPTPTASTDAQGHLFTQAATPNPETAAADTAEVIALRAEVEAYRAWINGLCEQPVSNGTINLDKVRRLIALSRSPNENEARNAAALACKAICDAGLIVISADDPRLNGSGTDLDMAALKRSMTDAFVDIFNMARAARVHP